MIKVLGMELGGPRDIAQRIRYLDDMRRCVVSVVFRQIARCGTALDDLPFRWLASTMGHHGPTGEYAWMSCRAESVASDSLVGGTWQEPTRGLRRRQMQ